MECRICGKLENNEMMVIRSVMHNGLYCKKCNSWIKWIGKKELKTIQAIGEIEVR